MMQIWYLHKHSYDISILLYAQGHFSAWRSVLNDVEDVAD